MTPIPLNFAYVVQKLLSSRTGNGEFTLPVFHSGDKMPINIYALAGTEAPWEEVAPASYSPEVAIYKDDGTQLAYQNTWTPGTTGNVYEGTLNLTDAAMNTAVSALTPAETLTAYFEIRLTDADGQPWRARYPVLIRKGLISTASATVAPDDVALTVSQASNLYMRKEHDGTPFIRTSRDGSKSWLIWYDNDGQEQKQPLQ